MQTKRQALLDATAKCFFGQKLIHRHATSQPQYAFALSFPNQSALFVTSTLSMSKMTPT